MPARMPFQAPKNASLLIFSRGTRRSLLPVADGDLTLAPRPRRRPPRCSVVATVLVPLPVRQHTADPRAVGQLVHLLEVLPADLERLRRHVGDVFPDQLARVDGRLVDLLQQEGSERFDAGAQEGAVEGDVDSFEGDGGEAALQVDGLGFRGGLGGAVTDDFDEPGFDAIEGTGLDEAVDVDVLGFEVVGDICQAVESTKLEGGISMR